MNSPALDLSHGAKRLALVALGQFLWIASLWFPFAARAATRSYSTNANGSFSTYPDTGQPLANFDLTLFAGSGTSGAAITVNSNVPNLVLGTGTTGSTINGNGIAFLAGPGGSGVPSAFTLLQTAAAPLLTLAGNVANVSGISQTLSTNLVESYLNKNNVPGYIFDTGAGGIVVNGTIGSGTFSSPNITAALRKSGTGTLILRPPVSGGNNLGTATFTNVGSLVDSTFVDQGTLLIDYDATLAARTFNSVGYLPNDNGTLTVNGTFVGSADLNIGDQVNSVGTVNLNPGGAISCVTSYVGKTGKGTLNLAGGDYSASGYTSIGTYSGSQGFLNLNDGNYTVPGDFNVSDANGSVGTLNINGGNLQVYTMFVGKGSGSGASGTVGTVTQTGGYVSRTSSGSTSITIEWRIGGGTSGTTQARGTYNMQGGALQVGTPFQVGSYGIGVFNQTGGTVIANSYANAGRFAGCNGTITVTGGTFNQSDATTRLIVAENGTGVITVGSSTGTPLTKGTIIASGGLVVAPNSNSIGTFNLNGGGTLQASYISSAFDPNGAQSAGNSTFNFNGGTLQALNSGAVFNGGTTFLQSLFRANVQAGGAIIDTGNESVLVAQALSHDNTANAPALDGGLTKLGAGTLTLAGTNTHTGGTVVGQGTLQVLVDANLGTGGVTVGSGALLALPDSFSLGRALTVNMGGTVSAGGTGLTVNGGPLSGSGTVNATVTVNNGGLLAGPLTVNGALNVATGGRVLLNGGGTLRVNGNLVNGGFMLLGRGAGLALGSGATFTNNGTLDVSTGNFVVPPGFINRGVVIDSSVVKVKSVSRQAGGSITVAVDTYTGHNYRLQRAAMPNAASYADVSGVAAQTGSTGTVATFTDASPLSGQGFYRVVVDP